MPGVSLRILSGQTHQVFTGIALLESAAGGQISAADAVIGQR